MVLPILPLLALLPVAGGFWVGAGDSTTKDMVGTGGGGCELVVDEPLGRPLFLGGWVELEDAVLDLVISDSNTILKERPFKES